MNVVQATGALLCRTNPRRRRPLQRRIVGVLAAISLQACAVVHIENPDGSATVVRRLGVVAIQPGQTSSSVVQVTSVGVHGAFGVWSLGFGRTEAATVAPGTCQLVVWAATPATVQSLRDLVGPDTSVCVIKNRQ